MTLHNDAVKGLTYPQEDKKDYGDFGDLNEEKEGEKDIL
jgi:hypothetical protein